MPLATVPTGLQAPDPRNLPVERVPRNPVPFDSRLNLPVDRPVPQGQDFDPRRNLAGDSATTRCPRCLAEELERMRSEGENDQKLRESCPNKPKPGEARLMVWYHCECPDCNPLKRLTGITL